MFNDGGIGAFNRKMDNLQRAYQRMPGRAAVEFSKQRFQQQNWIDNSTEPWRKRKENAKRAARNRGRAILIKSGRLKRSIQKRVLSATRIVISSDVPYAAAHNFGLKKIVTVKSHKRGRYSTVKEGTGTYSLKTRRERMRSHRVGIIGSQKTVEDYKMRMNFPRRQFLGESRYLARRIERDMASETIKALKS